MNTVLVLGANGKIARIVERSLLDSTDVQMRLFLRDASRLTVTDPARQERIEGDATDAKAIAKSARGVDVVYANLGNAHIEQQARAVVEGLDQAGVKRLIWISTLGIYDEVPGAFGVWNHQQLDGGYLETYAAAAKVIEQSDLEYTIIRPAWLSNKDTVSYELTYKGELFKGTEVSRASVADFVVSLITNPSQQIRRSLGVNQPNTDGDKPSFIH